MGRKHVRLRKISYTVTHSEVLHRVLYPVVHGNGFKKKEYRIQALA